MRREQALLQAHFLRTRRERDRWDRLAVTLQRQRRESAAPDGSSPGCYRVRPQLAHINAYCCRLSDYAAHTIFCTHRPMPGLPL